MSVKDIAQLSYPKFVISRLWRDGNVSIPTSEKVIKEGDRLLVITSEKNVPALTVLFGEQENTDWNKEDIDWNAIDSQLISQRIVVTRPELNGKKLGSLHLRNHYGINISRVYRSGVLLLATAELTLQLGDRLTVVGEAAVDLRPDQYIRDIRKDSEGNIWSGGFYNLKCFDLKSGKSRLYSGLNSITCIREKDDSSMWIGTSAGLYLLDKFSGKYRSIDMPVESMHIHALYQGDDGVLYIGTSGSGLVLYNPEEEAFAQYYTDNCALISNNIYTILPKPDGDLLLSTENGIV